MFNRILLPFLILFLLPVFVNAQEVLPAKEVKKDKVYYLHNGKFTPKDAAKNYKKPHVIHNLIYPFPCIVRLFVCVY